MSEIFRELLKKVGSGTHTSKDLTRSEAATATKMMLLQEATPAQIGAFMIAHRIKRPTPEELAGMLDAYDSFGPKLEAIDASPYPVNVFSNPYDGRSRNAPVMPITALILATAGIPLIMHGGDCMPTKYGIPLVEIWQGLGVDFSPLTLPQSQQIFANTGIGFVYLPQHFPTANGLVPYREQIGKRPTIATLELVWFPYSGDGHLISGFVHPPSEERFQKAFALKGINNFTTVKGLEGSCDLAQSRTAIIGINKSNQPNFQRFHLHPRDYDLGGQDVLLESTELLIKQIKEVLQGKPGELMSAAILNGGFYLWHSGFCPDLNSGFAQAEAILTKGEAAAKLESLSDLTTELTK